MAALAPATAIRLRPTHHRIEATNQLDDLDCLHNDCIHFCGPTVNRYV